VTSAVGCTTEQSRVQQDRIASSPTWHICLRLESSSPELLDVGVEESLECFLVQDHLSGGHDLAVKAESRGGVSSEGHNVASCMEGRGENGRVEGGKINGEGQFLTLCLS
jgi:hypothetical protein